MTIQELQDMAAQVDREADQLDDPSFHYGYAEGMRRVTDEIKCLQYYTKNVYGNEMLYLAKQSDRTLWLRLTGLKTITTVQMVVLTELTGIAFERVFGPEGNE